MSMLWPILHYADAGGAVAFLVDVFGFRADVIARDDDGDIVHAEVSVPGGGSLVVGSTKHTGGVHGGAVPGSSAMYVVTTEIDVVSRRVVEDGRGSLLGDPQWTHFGNGARAYAFTATDPEGNMWTFGTYRGGHQGSSPSR